MDKLTWLSAMTGELTLREWLHWQWLTRVWYPLRGRCCWCGTSWCKEEPASCWCGAEKADAHEIGPGRFVCDGCWSYD